jgi:hypothetical protein
MMDANGSHRTRLTGGRFANLQPTWGADGSIYFISDRGEPTRDSLWSLDPVEAPAPGTGGPAETAEGDDASEEAADAAEDSAQPDGQANAAPQAEANAAQTVASEP